MKLKVHGLNISFCATLQSSISVKDIIFNLPEKLSTSSNRFAVYNSKQEKLQESDLIPFNKSTVVELYIVPLILPAYQRNTTKHEDTPEQIWLLYAQSDHRGFTFTPPVLPTLSDEEIKFALFGGDGEITDAMFAEVKQFAAFVKQREAGKKE